MAHRPNPAHLVFVNKVLLKSSHVHLFMYCLWLHSLYNGRASCKRPFGLQVLKYSASKISFLQKTFASLYSRTLGFDAQILKSYHQEDVPNQYNGEIFFSPKKETSLLFPHLFEIRGRKNRKQNTPGSYQLLSARIETFGKISFDLNFTAKSIFLLQLSNSNDYTHLFKMLHLRDIFYGFKIHILFKPLLQKALYKMLGDFCFSSLFSVIFNKLKKKYC